MYPAGAYPRCVLGLALLLLMRHMRETQLFRQQCAGMCFRRLVLHKGCFQIAIGLTVWPVQSSLASTCGLNCLEVLYAKGMLIGFLQACFP